MNLTQNPAQAPESLLSHPHVDATLDHAFGNAVAPESNPLSGNESLEGWYVGNRAGPVGPFNADRLKALWACADIGPDTLCWREGLAEWTPLCRISQLADALAPKLERMSSAEALFGAASEGAPEELEFRPSAFAALQSLAEEEQRAAALHASAPAIPLALDAPVDLTETNPSEPSGVLSLRPEGRSSRRWWPLAMVAIASGVVASTATALAVSNFRNDRAPSDARLQSAPGRGATVPASAPEKSTPALSARTGLLKAPAAALPVAHGLGISASDPLARSTGHLGKVQDEFEREFGEAVPRPPAKAPAAVGAGDSGEQHLPRTLSTADIAQVVLSHKGEVSECVRAQGQAEPGTRGRLVMRWSISPEGKTSDVGVNNQELRSSYLAACLSRHIRDWTFPPHREAQGRVTFPFVF